jgi:hypothetical protein
MDMTSPAESTFRVVNTGSYTVDNTYLVGDNGILPKDVTTPLTPTAFPRGFMRLRFTASRGAPAAGPVQFIEFFEPLQFATTLVATTVTTNLSYSTGLLQLTTSDCPTTNYAECLPSGIVQTLNRVCASHGSGVVAGTTLTWNACDLMPPIPPSTDPSSAPVWTQDDSQVPSALLSTNPGCIEAVSVFGNVTCTGPFCGFAPMDTLGIQNGTWDQKWNDFTFSSTDYATATIGTAETTIPSPPGTYTSLTLVTAVPFAIQCGTAASLRCDVE